MAKWDAKDKTFLITGGASGLGGEYVKAFLDQGAKGVAILDIAEELGKALADTVNKVHGNKAVFIKCDVSKEDDISKAFDAVLAQFKQIDVIINNAGVMVDAPHIWRTATDVNVQGLVSFTLKGVKHMRKDEGGAGGSIINIASTVALSKTRFLPIYSGSKMAVLHFTQCLAVEPFYETTGIRMLTMCFGATDTPLLQNIEFRVYDPKLGKALTDSIVDDGVIYQRVDAAVAAFVDMFKIAKPATIWLSIDNKPVKEITDVINKVYKDFEKVMFA